MRRRHQVLQALEVRRREVEGERLVVGDIRAVQIGQRKLAFVVVARLILAYGCGLFGQ